MNWSTWFAIFPPKSMADWDVLTGIDTAWPRTGTESAALPTRWRIALGAITVALKMEFKNPTGCDAVHANIARKQTTTNFILRSFTVKLKRICYRSILYFRKPTEVTRSNLLEQRTATEQNRHSTSIIANRTSSRLTTKQLVEFTWSTLWTTIEEFN